MRINQDVELQVRVGALDLAHHKAREKYLSVFNEHVRKKFAELGHEVRAIANAENLAKAAYHEIHQHVYAEACTKTLADLQRFSRLTRLSSG